MRVRSGWVGVDCPRCSPGNQKFRLGFELHTNRAHCWVCGSFYPPKILSEILNISRQDAAALLGQVDRLPVEKRFTGSLQLPPGTGDLLPGHREYLIKDRHLNPDEIRDLWGVGGIGPAIKRPRYCLFIPIYDAFGGMVSWTTRTASSETSARYYSAKPEQEIIPHKHLLYGAHLARHTIVIEEGPIDAWTIGRGAVATLGVGYSRQQKSLMSKYPVRLVNFDAEPAAQRRAHELCHELSCFPGVTQNIVWETGKDANSAEYAEILEFKQKYFPEIYAV